MWKRVLCVLLVAVAARYIWNLLSILGFEKVTIYNHTPGDCTYVKGIESGSEDLELLSDGLVLVSAGYLTFKNRVEGAQRGHLYVYDINDHDKGATELQISGDYNVEKQLHPHGITAYEDKDSGKTFVFVINHQQRDEVVDVFEFHRDSMMLSFIKSQRDPLMKSLNNLVATGPDAFYATNEATTVQPFLRTLQDFLFLRAGYVLYCNITGCRKVSGPINEPNGIDLSRDGKYLYVNKPFSKQVIVFERNADNSLKGGEPIQVIDIGTCPDNIYVDEAGDLWLGCIPVAHKAMTHIEHGHGVVPAQVLRVRLGSTTGPHQDVELTEAFSDNGSQLNLSTVALYHRGVLLIGTLHEKMMRCNIKAL